MTAVPPAADPETGGPEAGYYPDPSIPGYVRYWDGLGWTPGTSRPAPEEGEELEAPRAAARSSAPSMRFVPPPVPQRLLPPIEAEPDQTGPIFLDATGPVPEARSEPRSESWFGSNSEAGPEARPDARPEPDAYRSAVLAPMAEALDGGSGSRWVADAGQQRGLLETASAPRWVSWGADAAGQEAAGQQSVAPEPVARQSARTASAAADVSDVSEDEQAHALAMTQAAALASEQARRASAARQQEADRTAGRAAKPLQAVQQRTAAPAAEPASPPTAPRTPTPAPSPEPTPAPFSAVAVPVPTPAPASAPAPKPAAAVAAAPRRAVRPLAPRPALLGPRLAARLFDLVMVGGIMAVLGAPVIQSMVTHLQEKIDAARLLPGETQVWLLDQQTLSALGLLALGLLLVGLLYEAVPTALWGRTLGKAVFGLRVLDRRSLRKPGFARALARWLSYQVLLVLLVGVLDLAWCMVDRPWRQCWHDKIGRTFVASGRSSRASGKD